MTRTSTPGGICAISTIEKIHDKYGYHMLERVLRLVVSAWEGDPASLSAAMLNGVTRLVNCYGDKIKEDDFKEKLGKVPVKELIRSAKERRGGTRGYAEAMLVYYNRRLRNQLPWDWLYKNKNQRFKDELEGAAEKESSEDVVGKEDLSDNAQDMEMELDLQQQDQE